MSEKAQNINDLVEYLIVNIVDDKNAVEIECIEEDNGNVTINVKVADGDVGHVIGREGHIIKAIRKLARACATKADIKVDVELVD